MRPPREQRRGTLTADPNRPVLDGFATSANAPPAIHREGSRSLADMPGTKASAQTSRTATTRHFQGDRGAAMRDWSALASMNLRDEISDEEARRNQDTGVILEVNTDNLPAIISTAITNSGDNQIVPEWHQVRNLPGYAANAIRALGRAVFSNFTDTPIEEIQTVTTLTNDTNEVKALMHWISKNGIRDDIAEVDFGMDLEAIRADVQLWNVDDYSFLLVKDPYGHYVYGWPGGRDFRLDEEPSAPRLR